MKASFTLIIFHLFFCLAIFDSAIFTQETPRAIVFYEFETNEIENSKLLTEKLNEFICRLSKEPETTKGFINIAGNTLLAEKIKLFVADNSNLKSRIVFNWNLKYPARPISNFDLYLIPQGAEIPYVNVHELCVCPVLSIDALTKVNKQSSAITFTAKTEGGRDKIKYIWKVSAGKIIEGQGTPTIKVDTEGAKEIIATVEISGVCEECEREASFKTKIQ